MSNKHQTEVLVVGAGPVGMLAALFLAQSGIKTRIIDQEARTAAHSYSCALHPQSIQLLRRAGIAVDVLQFGRRIDSLGFYDGPVRRAEIKLGGLPVEFPFAVVLDQSSLENLLEQSLRKLGVRIDWNHRLAGLEMNVQGAVAGVEKLCMTGKGYSVPDFQPEVQENLEIQSEFVIGADGVNSLVRGRLGIRCSSSGAPQHFSVYEVETGGDCGHETKVVLDDTTAVCWPLSQSRCRWSFQGSPEKAGTDFPQKNRDRLYLVEAPGELDNAHQLGALLKAHAPWYRDVVREVLWTADVQFEPRLARSFGRNLCWLAGDAAHQTGPVGMQSMNLGLREAADLAETLTQILRKGGSRDALRAYDRAHRAEWRQLLDFKAGGIAAMKADEWVRRRAYRIIGSIPASGHDLSELLKQAGIEYHFAGMPESALV